METIDYTTHEGASGSGGTFIRLKEKGQTVRVRLLTAPIAYKKDYTDDKGKTTEKTEYWWLAADMTEAAEKQDPSLARVGIFAGGAFIYGLVRNLAIDADWGDPSKYDIKFTRTEKKGQYYTANPITAKAIHKSVQALVDEFVEKEGAKTPMETLTMLYQKIVEKKEFDKATSGDTTDNDYNPFEDE